MTKLNAPCLGCKDRVAEPNCHITCEKYISFRKAKDEENAKSYHDKHLVMEANKIESDRIKAVATGKMYRRRAKR